jgi:hypothetical protein
MAKKLKLIGPEVVVTVAGVAAAEDSVEAEVVEVSEVDMAVAVMVDIHVVETVMVDTEEAVEVAMEEVAVVDSEADVGVVVEAVEAVTTAIKMVISPANARNNAKNGIKYRGPSFAVSESKI